MRKRSSMWSAVMATRVILLYGLLIVPASAQELDGDPELGARVWRDLSYCGDCHGWAGDGVADEPQLSGPSLRESSITPEIAYETIRCGRPGTEMPAFARNAWSESVPCYDMTEPLEGNAQPDQANTLLSDRYIEGLVAFIFEEFVGAGPVTREYCRSVLGEDSTRCGGYPTAADVNAGAEDEGGADD